MDNTLAKWAGWAATLCSVPFMIDAYEWAMNNIDERTFMLNFLSLSITAGILILLFIAVGSMR